MVEVEVIKNGLYKKDEVECKNEEEKKEEIEEIEEGKEGKVKVGEVERECIKEKGLDENKMLLIEEFLLSPKVLTSVTIRKKILDYIKERTSLTDWVEERFIEWLLKEK